MTDSEQTLGCGCCEGIEALTPASVENLPGLSALAYRVGTHGRFKESMVAALSGQPALQGLTTREDDDPAIALIDGWATVLDVLSFYQERIATLALYWRAKLMTFLRSAGKVSRSRKTWRI